MTPLSTAPSPPPSQFTVCTSRFAGLRNNCNYSWAAANGGVTNGGLRGVWPPFLEIGRNRPKSPFFCLFRPFPEGAKSTWEIQKTEEKGLFPQISSDFLKPPSLKPPFAALQHSPHGFNCRGLRASPKIGSHVGPELASYHSWMASCASITSFFVKVHIYEVLHWEVLNGVGVDGVGVIFPIFYAFFPFFYAFLCFSLRTRANNSNVQQKWGISLRPRLHRPRAELPDFTRAR